MPLLQVILFNIYIYIWVVQAIGIVLNNFIPCLLNFAYFTCIEMDAGFQRQITHNFEFLIFLMHLVSNFKNISFFLICVFLCTFWFKVYEDQVLQQLVAEQTCMLYDHNISMNLDG